MSRGAHLRRRFKGWRPTGGRARILAERRPSQYNLAPCVLTIRGVRINGQRRIFYGGMERYAGQSNGGAPHGLSTPAYQQGDVTRVFRGQFLHGGFDSVGVTRDLEPRDVLWEYEFLLDDSAQHHFQSLAPRSSVGATSAQWVAYSPSGARGRRRRILLPLGFVVGLRTLW